MARTKKTEIENTTVEQEVIDGVEVQETPAPKKRTRRTKAEIEAAKAAEAAAKAETAEAEEGAEEVVEEKPKRGRKKATEAAAAPKKKIDRHSFNTPEQSLVQKFGMNVEIVLLEKALGTTPSDPNLLSTYIASNAPDAKSRQEEIEDLGVEEVEKKTTTVFMKGYFAHKEGSGRLHDVIDNKWKGKINEDELIRLPFFYNYQLRGMFKDACGLLRRANCGDSATLTSYKKVIDGGIFIDERRIAIELPDEYLDDYYNQIKIATDSLPVLQRPIRTTTPQGERTALASSELIPAGSRLKFRIEYTNPKFREVIEEWLDYGLDHGLGAWRNSGLGIFKWRELDDNFMPFED